ncbi:MAG: SDR family oxidoreductase [Calditrichaeota bacterium]|nr:SDR family oxidoreductase [Calditrichota bacterium]
MSDKRCVLITGAAQGIGKCIAALLLKNSMRVGIIDIQREKLARTKTELSALGEVFVYRGDLGDEDFIRQSIADLAEKAGRLDAVINNAATAVNKPITELESEEWNRVLSVNLTACFLTAKHAVPYLKKSRGSIINIASTRALMSEPDTEAYSASKGGILALTHALAISLGPEVRVNCISPGWIDTREWQDAKPSGIDELTPEDHSQHPAGRVGKPEDIANMALFLLKPENDFITGANFVIDGGMTRKMIYE